MSGSRVKVAVRVRGNGEGLFSMEQMDENGWEFRIARTEAASEIRKDRSRFQVDFAIDAQKDQTDVWNMIRNDVTHKIFHEDGHVQYGVTLMAYGQTGSGKTYTMMGPNSCRENPLTQGKIDSDAGLILRLADEILTKCESFSETGETVFTIKFGMLEIYKEKIRDLLSNDPSRELRIKEKNHGSATGFYVDDQKFMDVKSLVEIAQLLTQGYKAASIGETNMNTRSSRGHTFITLKLQSSRSQKDHFANINIVDLAGSERSSATDRVSEDKSKITKRQPNFKGKIGTLDEGIAINQSLLALGDMIQSAQTRNPMKIRISSRKSVLNRLLLDSIGGRNAAFLVVTVRDESNYLSEIKSSLEFGQKARKVVNFLKTHGKDARASQESEKKLVEEKMELLAELESIDKLPAERDESLKDLQRKCAILQRISEIQEVLNIDVGKEREGLEERLEKFEIWMEKEQQAKSILANKALKSVFCEFQYRSISHSLRQRLVQPWVNIPQVPFLISEDPSMASVGLVLCSPSSSFGSHGSGRLILGSDKMLKEKKQLVKQMQTLKAHFSIARSLCMKDANERVEDAMALLLNTAGTKMNAKFIQMLHDLKKGVEFDQKEFFSSLERDIEDGNRAIDELKGKCKDVHGFIGLSIPGLREDHCWLSLLGEVKTKEIAITTPHAQAVLINGSFLPPNAPQKLMNGDEIILHTDMDTGAVGKFIFVEPGFKIPLSSNNHSNRLPSAKIQSEFTSPHRDLQRHQSDSIEMLVSELNLNVMPESESEELVRRTIMPESESEEVYAPNDRENVGHLTKPDYFSALQKRDIEGLCSALEASDQAHLVRILASEMIQIRTLLDEDLKQKNSWQGTQGVKTLRKIGSENISDCHDNLKQLNWESQMALLRDLQRPIPSGNYQSKPELNGEYFHVAILKNSIMEADKYLDISIEVYKDIRFKSLVHKWHQYDSQGSFPEFISKPADYNQSMVRMFMCERSLPMEMESSVKIESSLKAVSRCLMLIPVISLNSQNGSCSLESLFALNPREDDVVDQFLLEITVANALMEIPPSDRWLQKIVPAVSGISSEMLDQIFSKLSPDPSAYNNKRAATFLYENGYPVSSNMLLRSVRENIKLIFGYWSPQKTR
jgi:hypothetical protein